MIVIYTPPGLDPRQYDAEELTCGEADAISHAIAAPWAAVRQALRNQDPAAMRGVAWAWEKRMEPTLRFSHFDPPLKALAARFATDEVAPFLDQVDLSPLPPEQRDQVRRELVMYALDPDAVRAAIAEHDSPKAPATGPAQSGISELSGTTTAG